MERDEPIGLLIGAVRRRIRQAVTSRVRRYHLTTQQFWVLVAIYEHPGSSLGELAAHLRMDDPTASRVVFALAKRRFVQIRDDPADRRRSRLHVEASGTALAHELRELAHAVRAAAVHGLSSAELNALRGSLRKIIANMDRFQEGGVSKASAGARS
jgi:MarR family transcriptional regulator, transcriptional regulator for hemolysin